MGDRTVSVWLKAQVSDYVAKIGQAKEATKQLKTSLTDASKTESLRELSQTALVTGGLLTVAFAAPVKAAAEFDKAMSSVSAATHASVTELDQLRKAALQAGADTSFSAVEAAQGVTELAKAGVSTADILSGGLRGALDLAAAGELSVAEAAETAATAMTQFHLSGSDLPRVADLLAAGAGKAQGSVHDMAGALKMGGLVASQFGISVDDAVGTLASFASAGLIGSDAGTSFKTMLLHLSAPSKESAKLMRQLGIETYDASGQFVGMERFAGNLQNSLGKLTEAQRNEALATIFGADAIRAANVLFNQGATGIAHWRDEVNEAGYATDTANRKLDNLSGDLEKLRGSVEVNLIKAGTGANTVLRGLVQNAEQVVDAVGSLPEPVMATGVGLVGVAGAFALLTGGMGMAVVKAHETRKAMADLQIEGTRTERTMIGVSRGIGRVGAAMVVGQVAGAAFGKELNPQVSALTRTMVEWAETGKASGEAARLFGDDLENLKWDLESLGSGFIDSMNNDLNTIGEGLFGFLGIFDQSATKARERVAAYDQALTALVQSGRTDDAAKLFEKLSVVAKETGISVDDLRKGLPGYAAALDGASKAETDAIKSTQDHERAITATNNSLQDAIKMYGSLKDVLDALNGEGRSYERAANEAEAATDELAESVKEHGLTLDRTSAAGRANREAILKGTEAAEAAAQAVYDHNVATKGQAEATRLAHETYQKYIDALKKTLPATKETQAAWDELWGAVGNSPDLVSKTVQVTIPPKTLTELQDLDKAIKGLHDKEVKIIETGAPGAEAEAARLHHQIGLLQDKRVIVEQQGADPAAFAVRGLTDQISNLRDKQVAVMESGASDAEVRVRRLEEAIGRLTDKQVNIKAQVNAMVYEQREYVDLNDFRNTRGQRWGGVNVPAAKGLVSANAYPPGTRYQFAEPETGGEIFAPRFGDLGRTRSIVEYGVRNWWGGSGINWGPGSSGGTGGAGRVINVTVNVAGNAPPDIGLQVQAEMRRAEALAG